MSVSSRSSELFTGENWQVIYQAYTQINFNTSDPYSINQALQNYIQTNNPEQFNDWIEQSEFVTLMDLLAWLTGILAYKTDLTVRENILGVAQSKESILRLARFLSYNPSRNSPAQGTLQIVSLSTTDNVYDSYGVNLANTTILWNNPDNTNWYEQFTTVLNDAFVYTNPFGIPLSSGTISNVNVQVYRLNAVASSNNLGFSSTIGGTTMNFEVCNGEFTNGISLTERTPNPASAFQLFYLNDGNGNGSPQTGFFVLFKQGSLNTTQYNIPNPISNLILDVNTSGINQNDVWVQNVDDAGNVLTTWIPTPIMLNENITYNSLPLDQRNIYQVITRENDQISLRFSDGNFANAPTGNLLATYRVSNGLSYTINPQDIDQVSINITYNNPNNVQQTLTLNLSLLQTVSNATSSESIASIQQNAPLVYATQNRMVTGQDYNTFPLQNNLAIKLKALNRVYSGQSRYIDLNDPTGFYQDLSIFADDGIYFYQEYDGYNEVPITSVSNISISNFVANYVQPLLSTSNAIAAVKFAFLNAVQSGAITIPSLTWTQSSASLYTSTGTFSNFTNLITQGTLINFSFNGTTQWVGVESIQGTINTPLVTNIAGPVTLSAPIPSNATVLSIIPSYNNILSASAISSISSNISANVSFSLAYDYVAGWVVNSPISSIGPTVLNGTSVIMMKVDYLSNLWRIISRGIQYVFESITTVEWFDTGVRAIDQATGQASIDAVTIMNFNEDVNNTSGYALKKKYVLNNDGVWIYNNGQPEPRRTIVNFADTLNVGFPTNPDTFLKVISNNYINTYLFWQLDSQNLVEPYYSMLGFDNQTLMMNVSNVAIGTEAFIISGSTSLSNNTFWTYTSSGWVQDFSQNFSYGIGRGPNVATSWNTTQTPVGTQLNFHWKHYATYADRIDPASQSIQDIYVLTSTYDAAIRLWIQNGATGSKPIPPTELDLLNSFASLESYKMFSDSIIWHPVSYYLLFGQAAETQVQMQFKVIPSPSTTMTNGEIQTAVITAINKFFAVSLWDFGDTFYWSELSTYIHVQLSGIISSIVIVPLAANSAFGDGFEIPSNPNQIFISCAQVSDVIIISSNTQSNLRIQ